MERFVGCRRLALSVFFLVQIVVGNKCRCPSALAEKWRDRDIVILWRGVSERQECHRSDATAADRSLSSLERWWTVVVSITATQRILVHLRGSLHSVFCLSTSSTSWETDFMFQSFFLEFFSTRIQQCNRGTCKLVGDTRVEGSQIPSCHVFRCAKRIT